MPVSDQHDEYTEYLPAWEQVDDCVRGSMAVKNAGVKYLPAPNDDYKSTEGSKRYKSYKKRASYVNFTGHTKSGLLGLVFRKDTEIELPSQVEYLEDDADGGGLSLDQLSRDAVGETMEAGRYGFLVDYPLAPSGLSQAQVNELGLKACILPYKAKSVINWRTARVGGVSLLSMVVLAEDHEKTDESDEFKSEFVTYHRVLFLDEDGVYKQKLYDEHDEQIEIADGELEIAPRKSDGTTWKEIPFSFVGAQNNDPSVDKAPLFDISDINIAHYRNSADFEESSFMVGQPTLAVMGLSNSWYKDVLREKVGLGSMGGLPLPQGGDAKLLQADPNSMPMEGMREKEMQMIKIGAKIITDNSGNETAEAAKIRFAGSNSELGTVVGNVESAIKKCIEWALEFMGGGGEEITLNINRQFYDATIDPQLLMSQIQLMDRGVIAKVDVRGNLRKGGMINDDRSDEDIDREAETSNPLL